MWKFTSTLSIRIRGLDIVVTEKNFNRKSRYWSWLFIIVYETSCLELWSEVTIKMVKGKVFPFYAMVAYRGSGDISPLILKLGTRWRWVVNFTPRSSPHPSVSAKHSNYTNTIQQLLSSHPSSSFTTVLTFDPVNNTIFKKIVSLSETLKNSDYVLSNDKWKSGRGLILSAALHVSAGTD